MRRKSISHRNGSTQLRQHNKKRNLNSLPSILNKQNKKTITVILKRNLRNFNDDCFFKEHQANTVVTWRLIATRFFFIIPDMRNSMRITGMGKVRRDLILPPMFTALVKIMRQELNIPTQRTGVTRPLEHGQHRWGPRIDESQQMRNGHNWKCILPAHPSTKISLLCTAKRKSALCPAQINLLNKLRHHTWDICKFHCLLW